MTLGNEITTGVRQSETIESMKVPDNETLIVRTSTISGIKEKIWLVLDNEIMHDWSKTMRL